MKVVREVSSQRRIGRCEKQKKKKEKNFTNRKIWHLLNHSDNFSTVFTQGSKNKLPETDCTHMPLARQQGCPAALETKHEETRASGNHHQCDSIGAGAALSPASTSGSSRRKEGYAGPPRQIAWKVPFEATKDEESCRNHGQMSNVVSGYPEALIDQACRVMKPLCDFSPPLGSVRRLDQLRSQRLHPWSTSKVPIVLLSLQPDLTYLVVFSRAINQLETCSVPLERCQGQPCLRAAGSILLPVLAHKLLKVCAARSGFDENK